MEIKAILKVNVIKGKNLAVRDVFTSDPYVKLSLGGHTVKTRVIKRDLNPEWNEQLTLAIPDPLAPLKLFVFDKNIFMDDKMGNAQINLHPLSDAADLVQLQHFEQGTIIHQVMATPGNCFTKDSVIKFKDGHAVQEVSIKLQNVEKGQIKLELKWLPVL